MVSSTKGFGCVFFAAFGSRRERPAERASRGNEKTFFSLPPCKGGKRDDESWGTLNNASKEEYRQFFPIF